MPSTQVSDSLLDHLVAFYRILGLRVTSCTFDTWKNCLSILWSIFLICPPLFSLLFNSPLTFAIIPFTKPLLTWLQAFNDALFTYSSVGLLLYYQLNGPTILRHLKNFPKRPSIQTSKQCNAGKLSFAWFLFLSQGLFALGYVPFFAVIFKRTQSVWQIIYTFSLYINYHYLLLTPFLLHYAQYTLTVSLRQLVKESERLQTGEIVNQIQALAKWSKQLNRLLAFPLVLWLLNYSIDLLVNIAFLGAIVRTSLMTFFTALALYFLYIVHFQRSIQLLLLELSEVGVSTVEKSGNLKRLPIERKRDIQLKGLTVYSEALTFKLNSLCAFDTPTYCTLLVVILNYSVLFLQTK